MTNITEPENRARLIRAMAEALTEKGYANTTVADVVARARVSKRTFYEHFATKEDALQSMIASAADASLNVLRQAIDPGRPWIEQVDGALKAYLDTLISNPPLTRALYVEVLTLGMLGLSMRRMLHRRFSDFILTAIGEHGAQADLLARGLVGAIHELVLEFIEENRIENLLELIPPIGTMIRAVFNGPGSPVSQTL